MNPESRTCVNRQTLVLLHCRADWSETLAGSVPEGRILTADLSAAFAGVGFVHAAFPVGEFSVAI